MAKIVSALPWPQSTISLLCTICSLLCTICSLLCTICSLLCTICSLLCTICSLLHTICSLLCTGEEHSRRYDMNLPARLLVRQPAPMVQRREIVLWGHRTAPQPFCRGKISRANPHNFVALPPPRTIPVINDRSLTVNYHIDVLNTIHVFPFRRFNHHCDCTPGRNVTGQYDVYFFVQLEECTIKESSPVSLLSHLLSPSSGASSSDHIEVKVIV